MTASRLIPILSGAVLLGAPPAFSQTLTLAPADQQPTATGQPGRQNLDKFQESAPLSNVFIVQLASDPVATYRGGVEGLNPTAISVTGADRLDVRAPEAVAYEAHLGREHADFAAACEAAIGRSVQPLFDYRHAFNGVAVELSDAEAQQIRSLPHVVRVEREKWLSLSSDIGPQHIAADAIWFGPKGLANKGEGVVIAVLDSGINSDHPSFADIGGDGYDHTNPLGSGNYLGYCVANPSFCNDKLIGAYGLVRGPTDPTSPEDSDGHGSHTAGTAAGNLIRGATINAPTTTFVRDILGVAPHANIIAYDVCIDSCPGSALLAAVNQVVIDASVLPNGIHALNYSISGGNDPYNDTVELAFLNATAAGVYVSASAGNSGPGASTTGHNGPWVATVAALTHTRRIDNSLTRFSSDGGSLSDILGAGLTTGYGPAPIVYAGNFPTSNGSRNDTNPAQCLDPFPAGTFSGQIVVCDRGEIARVAKGQNVLLGGAGGFVLANTAAEGESIVADPHFLPGVHIGARDADVLRAWLAANTNTLASISGFVVDTAGASADNLAAFSSRGPAPLDVIKPDIGGPGVSIIAPVHSRTGALPPEFDFLSGTSMSSPHNAGAGALVRKVTGWTPYEVRSAIMMTSSNYYINYKENGTTQADPFDTGAGRIDLNNTLQAGLVLDETPANFLAANPATGGDPTTLNLASMQNGQCIGECSWNRTVRNVSGRAGTWKLKVIRAEDGFDFSVTPDSLSIPKGGHGSFTVRANTTLAPAGTWDFPELQLHKLGRGPDLHMPIAVRPSVTSLPNVFSHTVNTSTTFKGETLNYSIRVSNGNLRGPISIRNDLPPTLDIVPGSLTQTVSGGTTTTPFGMNSSGELAWEGSLTPGTLTVGPGPSPFGYFSLASFGVQPFGCPSNCDEGAWIVTVPPFIYDGSTYTQVILSVNGTIEAGTSSGLASSFINQQLPSATPPNNIIAPLWTDLDMGVDGNGAEWYVATLNAGPRQFQVYEWNNVPLWNSPTNRYTFQVWIETGTSNIWFVYQTLGSLAFATVGVENADGTTGASYYFNGAGTAPSTATDLTISNVAGGSAVLGFQAKSQNCQADGTTIVSETTLANAGTTERAIAVTRCSIPK